MNIAVKTLKALAFLILAFLGLYFYYSSSYYIGKLTQAEIEKELGVVFNSRVSVLEYESYGWAEEWREKLLFKLNDEDCKSVSLKLTEKGDYSESSDYHLLFSKQGLKPASLLTSFFSSSLGNFREYAMDLESCTLFRLNHVE